MYNRKGSSAGAETEETSAYKSVSSSLFCNPPAPPLKTHSFIAKSWNALVLCKAKISIGCCDAFGNSNEMGKKSWAEQGWGKGAAPSRRLWMQRPSCTDNAKENCMQDHINKRIPTLLTIMLTEAQSAIENCWAKKQKEAHNTKPKQQKTSRNYKSAPNKKKESPVSTLVLVHWQ